MKRYAFFLIALFFFFQACKKDDSQNNQPPQESVLDYMPLTIGNQWIYENSRCDSGEINCEPPFSVDTNIVTKDTLIGDKTYFKIEGNQMYWKGPRYYRDSGDYIVDNHGTVIFTIDQSDQTYNHEEAIVDGDTIYHWYYQLMENPENISVMAGDFECYDFRGYFFGREDDFQNERNMHNYFSKDVGLVSETAFFASSSRVTKRELIGYHIEPNGINP